MTIQDALYEFEAFPYSKTYFNLLKEGAELDLQAHYINTQSYLAEYAEETVTQALAESGYLMESTNERELNVITEGFLDAIGNFFKNIWEIIKKAVTTVISFFKNLFTREPAAIDIDAAKEYTYESEDYDKLMNLLEKYNIGTEKGETIRSGSKSFINVGNLLQVTTKNKNLMASLLSFAISGQAEISHKELANAINMETFMDQFDQIVVNYNTDTDKKLIKLVNKAATAVNKLIKDAVNEKTIFVDFSKSDKKLSRVNEFANGMAKINEMINEAIEEMKNPDGDTAAIMHKLKFSNEDLTKLANKLTAITKDTISFYQINFKFWNALRKCIGEIVNGKKAAK